ncbi:ABC transporter substrate-binding protein [Psychromonas sp. Urea-02u-13]|uniref:ABC transporter substrate-binding protein n=1 Tax=Psychromonas sp. Urea-02u-13 TaxID=2058326 RepID=UPI001E498617|nr:ABC transporter substrate-binding protein [Psychromonas sp. Urea-02u-13]
MFSLSKCITQPKMANALTRCLFVLLAASLLPNTLLAKDILTSTPVTYMLATQLMATTDISTVYLPPKRYGIERQGNWFAGKGEQRLLTAGSEATVAITLGALWPQDSLFVFARQGNIKLIEVDASQSLSPRAKSIATVKYESGKQSLYAWLNPNNLGTMASIVSADLQRVWPKHAKTIEKNQQVLMVKLRQLINQQQQFLLDKQIDSVVLLSDQLEDFASANQLFVVHRLVKAQLDWTEQDKKSLQLLVEESPDVWLLTTKKVSKQLQVLLPNFSNILVIDSLDRWGRAGITIEQPLLRWECESY